jgi:hypothetical protein
LVWFTNHLEVKPFEMGGQVVKDKHGDEKLGSKLINFCADNHL